MKRSPFDEMDRLFDRMSRMDDRMWGREVGHTDLDVADYGDEFVVMADLPGFEREEIGLTVEDGTLTIRAERDHESAADGDEHRYVHRERRHESVTRQVDLPAAVVEAEATATYKNGVLEIRLPKEVADDDEDAHHIDVE